MVKFHWVTIKKLPEGYWILNHTRKCVCNFFNVYGEEKGKKKFLILQCKGCYGYKKLVIE